MQAVLDLTEFQLADGTYHVVDLWTGAYLGRVIDRLPLGALAPHGMRLLSLRPDDPRRPLVVGSTGHLLGAAMDVVAEEWNPSSGTLTVHFSTSAPTARRGELLVLDTHDALRRVPIAGHSIRI